MNKEKLIHIKMKSLMIINNIEVSTEKMLDKLLKL